MVLPRKFDGITFVLWMSKKSVGFGDTFEDSAGITQIDLSATWIAKFVPVASLCLAFWRVHDFDKYIMDIRAIFESPNLRFPIKRHGCVRADQN